MGNKSEPRRTTNPGQGTHQIQSSGIRIMKISRSRNTSGKYTNPEVKAIIEKFNEEGKAPSTREILNTLLGVSMDLTSVSTDVILLPILNPRDGKDWHFGYIPNVNGKVWYSTKYAKLNRSGDLDVSFPEVKETS